MKLCDKQTIQELCQMYHIRPSKHHGQNFLIDEEILNDIVSAASLTRSSKVIEIGPGFGVLTENLAKVVSEVVTVEQDRRLCDRLENLFQFQTNIHFIRGNILDFTNADLLKRFSLRDISGYEVVANIPYSITASVFKKFLEEEPKPSAMTLLVQKEVAERVCAKAKDMSILSVSVQLFSEPSILRLVSKQSFFPIPEVDSAILRIENIRSNETLERDVSLSLKEFFRTVRIGFSAKRKKLLNNLVAGRIIEKIAAEELFRKLGFDLNIRAQGLNMAEWGELAQALQEKE
jgi:16S rRNA (adenine1518-N6/adenine1519-N6)-dimethyltransferase